MKVVSKFSHPKPAVPIPGEIGALVEAGAQSALTMGATMDMDATDGGDKSSATARLEWPVVSLACLVAVFELCVPLTVDSCTGHGLWMTSGCGDPRSTRHGLSAQGMSNRFKIAA